MRRTSLSLAGLSAIAAAALAMTLNSRGSDAVTIPASAPAPAGLTMPAEAEECADLAELATTPAVRARLDERTEDRESATAVTADAEGVAGEAAEGVSAACEVRFQLTSTAHRSWASTHWHAYESHNLDFGAKGRKIALVDPGNGYHAAAALHATGESPWIFDRLTGWALPLAGACGDASKITLNLTIPESFPVRVYPTAPDSSAALDASTIVYRIVESGYFEVVARERRGDGITCELVPGDYVIGVNALGYEPLFEPITVTDQAIEQVIELAEEGYFTVHLSALEQGQPASFNGAQLHSITATDKSGRDVLLRLSGDASSERSEDGEVETVAFAAVELALEPSAEITVTVVGQEIAIHPGLAGQTIEIELL